MKDLKNGEGKREECRRDEAEGKTKKRGNRESKIGKDDKTVMERNGALPRDSPKECSTFVFLVIGECGEVDDKKICKGKRGKRQQKCGQQAGHFAGLQEEGEGWDDVGNMNGEDKFAKSAVDQLKRRDGANKDEDKGKEQKLESGEREGEVEVDEENNDGNGADHADGSIEKVVAESLFFLRGFTSDERLIVRTEDFAQIGHAGLSQQGNRQAKHERNRLKRLAQIGRDARAEEVGQCGKQEVEGAGKAKHLVIGS